MAVSGYLSIFQLPQPLAQVCMIATRSCVNAFISKRDVGSVAPATGPAPVQALPHWHRPLYPTSRNRLPLLSASRSRLMCTRVLKSAPPLPNNLREPRLPLCEAVVQVGPPIWLPIPPIEVFVKGHALAVVLALAPCVHNARPQTGCYEVIQRGNELFIDHEPG